jgi:hypothetical protein
MFAEKIETLKRALVDAKNLADVQEYFLTHFAEDDKFMDLGKPVYDAFLESVIDQVMEQVFESKVIMRQVMLIKLPEYHFIHGSCVVEGRFLSVFYFEEVPIGMVAVASFVPGVNPVFARFQGLK